MVVTALYIALSALLILWLTLRIVGMRWQYKVSLGDGDNPWLHRAIRAHANATETLPIALLLLAALEFMAVGGVYLHILGCMLVLGRLLHAYQISFQKSLVLRMAGMVLTVTMIGVSAMAILALTVF